MRTGCGARAGSAVTGSLGRAATTLRGPTVFVQLVVHAVDQGLPTRLDHVVRHADRSPAIVLIARLDQHAHERRGPLPPAEHTHLVVVEAHLLYLGIELAKCLAKCAVERIHRTVPLRRRVLDLA